MRGPTGATRLLCCVALLACLGGTVQGRYGRDGDQDGYERALPHSGPGIDPEQQPRDSNPVDVDREDAVKSELKRELSTEAASGSQPKVDPLGIPIENDEMRQNHEDEMATDARESEQKHREHAHQRLSRAEKSELKHKTTVKAAKLDETDWETARQAHTRGDSSAVDRFHSMAEEPVSTSPLIQGDKQGNEAYEAAETPERSHQGFGAAALTQTALGVSELKEKNEESLEKITKLKTKQKMDIASEMRGEPPRKGFDPTSHAYEQRQKRSRLLAEIDPSIGRPRQEGRTNGPEWQRLQAMREQEASSGGIGRENREKRESALQDEVASEVTHKEAARKQLAEQTRLANDGEPLDILQIAKEASQKTTSGVKFKEPNQDSIRKIVEQEEKKLEAKKKAQKDKLKEIKKSVTPYIQKQVQKSIQKMFHADGEGHIVDHEGHREGHRINREGHVVAEDPDEERERLMKREEEKDREREARHMDESQQIARDAQERVRMDDGSMLVRDARERVRHEIDDSRQEREAEEEEDEHRDRMPYLQAHQLRQKKRDEDERVRLDQRKAERHEAREQEKMNRDETRAQEHEKNIKMTKSSMNAAMSPALYAGYKKQGPPTSAKAKAKPKLDAKKKKVTAKKIASLNAVEKSLSKRLEPFIPLWIFLLVTCGSCCLGCVAYGMRDNRVFDEYGSSHGGKHWTAGSDI